eukprot:GFYU01000894.1.p1 GENE.GFYU01000894.1~~GFYU01000894.1.p1  ORF type:complete len:211 (+),score=47.10 GFYU01000894.1:104-736(+)
MVSLDPAERALAALNQDYLDTQSATRSSEHEHPEIRSGHPTDLDADVDVEEEIDPTHYGFAPLGQAEGTSFYSDGEDSDEDADQGAQYFAYGEQLVDEPEVIDGVDQLALGGNDDNVDTVENEAEEDVAVEGEGEVEAEPVPKRDVEGFDKERIQTIRSLMSGFKLPEKNIPHWASNMSEDVWKTSLLSTVTAPTSDADAAKGATVPVNR